MVSSGDSMNIKKSGAVLRGAAASALSPTMQSCFPERGSCFALAPSIPVTQVLQALNALIPSHRRGPAF